MNITAIHNNKIACCELGNRIEDLEQAITKLYYETKDEDEGELGWYIKDNLYFYLHDLYAIKNGKGNIITTFGPGTEIKILGRHYIIN